MRDMESRLGPINSVHPARPAGTAIDRCYRLKGSATCGPSIRVPAQIYSSTAETKHSTLPRVDAGQTRGRVAPPGKPPEATASTELHTGMALSTPCMHACGPDDAAVALQVFEGVEARMRQGSVFAGSLVWVVLPRKFPAVCTYGIIAEDLLPCPAQSAACAALQHHAHTVNGLTPAADSVSSAS